MLSERKIPLSVAIWGAAFLGMASFAGTFPVTRALTKEFTAIQLGSGRVIVAGLIGALVLFAFRPGLPGRDTWVSLGIASLGVAFGFPLLSAAALIELSASSAAVAAGILPLLTALAATLIAGERPGRIFWLGCGFGCTAVVLQALLESGWQWQARNSLFFAAMLCASIGYAAGARATRRLPAWQVACWLALLAAPINLLLLFGLEFDELKNLPPIRWGWLGFAYLVLFSQLFGFVCWNHALAHGGIAKVGQLQLLQPFLTLIVATVWLDEAVSPWSLVLLFLVVASIALARSKPSQFKPITKEEDT